jgi:hypothetical protein
VRSEAVATRHRAVLLIVDALLAELDGARRRK